MPELQKNLSQHGPTKATASPKTLEIADAQPFPFTMPPTGRAALLMIDWQRDFLEVGGFGHALGNDVSTLRKGLGPAAEVLKAARKAGIPIVHTLEAHTPDLSDLPAAKQRRLAPTQRAIGEALPSDPARGRLLVAGEPGNAIVPEVAPLARRAPSCTSRARAPSATLSCTLSSERPGSPISSSPASRPRSVSRRLYARRMTEAMTASSSPTRPNPTFHILRRRPSRWSSPRVLSSDGPLPHRRSCPSRGA